MPTYEVLLSETAVSQLRLLESKQNKRIKDALACLAQDPFHSRSGTDIKKLRIHSDPPLFRLRIGMYRAIYFVIDRKVKVTEIIHRSKGYKWLE
ncbi:MAG: type II toxin-antitoxin system RelE/ParE family toxin [Candidatus Thorarchaeota archaeon]|nr:type II toxin-antitoxin system RelE/ParE family toxin [Candidatus Thorarchaeota archaeon]